HRMQIGGILPHQVLAKLGSVGRAVKRDPFVAQSLSDSLDIVGVLHGVESGQIGCFPRQTLAASPIRFFVQFVLLPFGADFCDGHRFELGFRHFGTEQRWSGKKSTSLVPNYKVAVPSWTLVRGGDKKLRKRLDRRTARASLGNEQGFWRTFLCIALDDDCGQSNRRPGGVGMPARHADKAAFHIPALSLNLEDVTVGLLPSVAADRRLAGKQRRRQKRD